MLDTIFRKMQGLLARLRRLLKARFHYTPKDIESAVRHQMRTSGTSGAERWARRAERWRLVDGEYLHRIMFDELVADHPQAALSHAERALAINPGNRKLVSAVRRLADGELRQGEIQNAWLATEMLEGRIGESLDRTRAAAYTKFFAVALEGERGGATGSRVQSLTEEAGQRVRSKILRDLEHEGLEAFLARMIATAGVHEEERPEFARLIFALVSENDRAGVTELGEYVWTLNQGDPDFLLLLAKHYQRKGNLCRQAELFEVFEARTGNGKPRSNLNGELSLLKDGFPLPPASARGTANLSSSHKIFYLLHNSLPFTSGGYATRAHGILRGLTELGIEVEGVTRYGFPFDRKGLNVKSCEEKESIDGVSYRRLITRTEGYGCIPLRSYLERYSAVLEKLSLSECPTVLHAASNYMNGVVANFVGRKLGIPSIYEVRGLWEVTRLSRQPEWVESDIYALQRKMEAEAADGASAVVTITEALRSEMMSRGVPADRIQVIPNGTDTSRFQPRPPDAELLQKLKLQGKTVVGYVGSIVDYEGLELLVDALGRLKARGRNDVAGVIVGDGDFLPKLRLLADDLGVGDLVTFTGRVPHHEVERYYSLIDITPFPRRGLPVCEMVSPMKPFESMCMQKAVLASDVAALGEIVADGETGIVHRKDDVESLTTALELLLDSSELRERLGENAREWVIQNRDWKVLARRFVDLYDQVLSEQSVERRVV